MAAHGSSLRQDCLKVSEARVSCIADCEIVSSTLEVLLLYTFCLGCLCTTAIFPQVRALTREVGSLKEDLRREVKRRERAVISTREAEELRQEAESRVKQLEYAKRYRRKL